MGPVSMTLLAACWDHSLSASVCGAGGQPERLAPLYPGLSHACQGPECPAALVLTRPLLSDMQWPFPADTHQRLLEPRFRLPDGVFGDGHAVDEAVAPVPRHLKRRVQEEHTLAALGKHPHQALLQGNSVFMEARALCRPRQDRSSRCPNPKAVAGAGDGGKQGAKADSRRQTRGCRDITLKLRISWRHVSSSSACLTLGTCSASTIWLRATGSKQDATERGRDPLRKQAVSHVALCAARVGGRGEGRGRYTHQWLGTRRSPEGNRR